MEAALINDDLVGFVREYVINVCRGVVFTSNHREMDFNWKSNPEVKLVRDFRPFMVGVLLDNLISNSKKAGAKCIRFIAEADGDTVIIKIRDDGKGIPKNVGNRVFELGYTTTNGSGFGLFHAATIAENLDGNLRLSKTAGWGAEFLWEIPK